MEYNIEIRKVEDFLDDNKYLTNINMQRKFIYTHKQAALLLDSIQKGIPVPAIYLWDNKDGSFDVLDGKQRITVLRLFNNPKYIPDQTYNFFIDHMDEDKFKKYEIPVIICSGTDEDRIVTFRRINTTAIPLKDFEIYNALYQGIFVEEFGDWGINLSPIEESFFGAGIRGENCIKALSLFTNDVEAYFKHNKDNSFIDGLKKQIDELVKITYDIFKEYNNDFYVLAKVVLENINDKSKINSWLLNKNKIVDKLNEFAYNGQLKLASSNESFYKEILNCYDVTGLDSTRFFSAEVRTELYKKLENGKTKGKKICPVCNKEYPFDKFEVDHIEPWSNGGRTDISNAQIMCKSCNDSKGART